MGALGAGAACLGGLPAGTVERKIVVGEMITLRVQVSIKFNQPKKISIVK